MKKTHVCEKNIVYPFCFLLYVARGITQLYLFIIGARNVWRHATTQRIASSVRQQVMTETMTKLNIRI